MGKKVQGFQPNLTGRAVEHMQIILSLTSHSQCVKLTSPSGRSFFDASKVAAILFYFIFSFRIHDRHETVSIRKVSELT